jgi:hypothetical protein
VPAGVVGGELLGEIVGEGLELVDGDLAVGESSAFFAFVVLESQPSGASGDRGEEPFGASGLWVGGLLLLVFVGSLARPVSSSNMMILIFFG